MVPADPGTNAVSLRSLLGVAVVAGLLSTPPLLSLGFWFGHPFFTVALVLRVRAAVGHGARRGAELLPPVLIAGLVTGAVTGAGIAVVDVLRRGAALPLVDLAGHVVYPVVGAIHGLIALGVGVSLGRRMRRGGAGA